MNSKKIRFRILGFAVYVPFSMECSMSKDKYIKHIYVFASNLTQIRLQYNTCW